MSSTRMHSPPGLDAKHSPVGLTLTELEATTSLRLTWFLTLNSTAVTCQESVVFQGLLVLSVHLNECTGDSHTQSLALTCKTTTIEVYLNIIFFSYFEQLQWLFNHVLKDS